jgi:hypothetical protein
MDVSVPARHLRPLVTQVALDDVVWHAEIDHACPNSVTELMRLEAEQLTPGVAAQTQTDASMVLKEAAEHYRVDIDAIALKMKQEFAAKAETRIPKYSTPKRANPKKKPAAA